MRKSHRGRERDRSRWGYASDTDVFGRFVQFYGFALPRESFRNLIMKSLKSIVDSVDENKRKKGNCDSFGFFL